MGLKGVNKSFDYNLIKIFDVVILLGNVVMVVKKLGIILVVVFLVLKCLQSYYLEELFSRGKGGFIFIVKVVDIY